MTWMVRAGRNGVYADEFVGKGLVGVSFSDELGPIRDGSSRDDVAKALAALYPHRKRASIINAAGQLYRFHFEVSVGDAVVTYDSAQRRYFVGEIRSDARHVPDAEAPLPYQRSVRWTKRVERDDLAIAARNTLGSTLTIFKLNDGVVEEIERVAVPIDAPDSPRSAETMDAGGSDLPPFDVDVAVDLDDIRESLVQRAEDFIDDVIVSLDPDQMEQLVAGILRAMGYRARVMPKGADRGVDVFASPDGLGLEEPRIFVEVKHRGRPMGAPALRTFMGGRRPGDRCLFVSTGGFTHEAKYEAERSNVPLTLIDLPTLRDLLTTHYESVDPETRQLVPLRRVYWPVAGEE